MKELKPYLRRGLTTSCPLNFFMNKRAGNTDKSTRQQQFPIFSPELSKVERGVELLSSCVYVCERFSQHPTSRFLHPYFAMCKLKYSMRDRQKPFSEFQQVAAVETYDKVRSKSFLKHCLYSTWFTFIEFVFKLVVACSFWVARVINTLRKPFEFKWLEVRFNRKQTSTARVPYNKLLANLASSSRTGEYWPLVVLCRPRCARSVLSWPWANIPRYGPRAQLVRG